VKGTKNVQRTKTRYHSIAKYPITSKPLPHHNWKAATFFGLWHVKSRSNLSQVNHFLALIEMGGGRMLGGICVAGRGTLCSHPNKKKTPTIGRRKRSFHRFGSQSQSDAFASAFFDHHAITRTLLHSATPCPPRQWTTFSGNWLKFSSASKKTGLLFILV
jgi:hypothetical protein